MERTVPVSRVPKAAAAPTQAVLTKAVLRAAEQLGMSNKALAGVIGLSEATVSRMHGGGYELQRGQKSFELGVLFVRLYRSLDSLLGGDTAVASGWLRNRNTALDGKPLEMIQTVPGLVNVIQYLDARRAVV
jgi:hypothetical protein